MTYSTLSKNASFEKNKLMQSQIIIIWQGIKSKQTFRPKLDCERL